MTEQSADFEVILLKNELSRSELPRVKFLRKFAKLESISVLWNQVVTFFYNVYIEFSIIVLFCKRKSLKKYALKKELTVFFGCAIVRNRVFLFF